MARIRTIKPDFFINDSLAELPPLDRLLFIGLWTQADREGRLDDRPTRIKVSILPYDDHDIPEALDRLQGKNFIIRYKIKECNYIQINNFLKHQYPNIKEQQSTIPAPCKHSTSIPLLRKGREHIYTYSPESYKLGILLGTFIKTNNPKNKNILDNNFENSTKRWAEDIEKINKIDKQSWEDIEKVITWCQHDTFWKSNILSGQKLREKFSQLQTKMITPSTTSLRCVFRGQADKICYKDCPGCTQFPKKPF